jgi:hypothetical protein
MWPPIEQRGCGRAGLEVAEVQRLREARVLVRSFHTSVASILCAHEVAVDATVYWISHVFCV